MQLGNIGKLLFFVAGFIFCSTILCQTTKNPSFVKFNINNVSTYFYNDGTADQAPSGANGFEYPIGSLGTHVYKSGFVWGAKVNNKILTGGSTFNSGLQNGKILPNGIAENPEAPSSRVYKVRPDFKTGDLSKEAVDEGKSKDEIYSQYQKDWNEWPAHKGAPYKDINANGKYDPLIDIPGKPGADQTLWFVANDLDSVKAKKLYGSPTMGIEMQCTIWGYNVNPHLKNAIFKEYRIINKSKNKFEDMYFGIWSDPDLGGNAGDDLVGCDTLRNLIFVYNGNDTDPSLQDKIPSFGFKLLQGPLKQGSNADTAKFLGRRIHGILNMNMTALGWFGKGSQDYHDPAGGDYINGTLDLYNLLQGYLNDGSPVINPFTLKPTQFPFSGDPVTGVGYLGGIQYPLGLSSRKSDHRMMLCSGPFNMAVGDTQEVVYAQFAEGGQTSNSRLVSITLLKQTANYLKQFYQFNLPNQTDPDYKLNVQAVPLDRKIALYWGTDPKQIEEVENTPSPITSFEGYNVYQISRDINTLGQQKLAAVIDIKNGKSVYLDYDIDYKTGFINTTIRSRSEDLGLQRFCLLTKDSFTGKPLSNGTNYEFGVSYFRIASNPNSTTLYEEGPVSALVIMPKMFTPGIKTEKTFGDIITPVHSSGNSNAEVSVTVIDPAKLTGNTYQVNFKTVQNKPLFDLVDKTLNKVVLSNQTKTSGEGDLLITDGFLLKVKNGSKAVLNDTYTFNTVKPVISNSISQLEIEKINVFPNPYYGRAENETSKYDRHVTFSYLPQRANIRIFNLAGQLVRKLSKDSNEAFFRWNMLNEDNFQIPTGLYIVHIELPDYGKVKILKLALLSEIFVPDRFVP